MKAKIKLARPWRGTPTWAVTRYGLPVWVGKAPTALTAAQAHLDAKRVGHLRVVHQELTEYSRPWASGLLVYGPLWPREAELFREAARGQRPMMTKRQIKNRGWPLAWFQPVNDHSRLPTGSPTAPMHAMVAN